MADTKEEISVNFKISPFKEMRTKGKDILERFPELKAVFKEWTVNEKIKANTRKWDEKKVEQAINYYVRFDLKVLDVECTDALKKLDKEQGKSSAKSTAKAKHRTTAEKNTLEKLKKYYTKIAKEVDKKIKEGLEDIEDDNEDKNAVKDGEAAFKKVSDFEPDGMIAKVADDSEKILVKLADRLHDDAEGASKHVASAKKDLEGVHAEFLKKTKDGVAAIAFLNKKAQAISKNKEVSGGLKSWGDSIVKLNNTLFAIWVKEVKGVIAALNKAISGIDKKGVDAEKVEAIHSDLIDACSGEKKGAVVARELKKLKSEFDKIKKDV